MANFGKLILTNLGVQEQYKAQAGEPLKFKRIGMGSGTYSGNIMALTRLVNENVSVSIGKGYVQNNAFTVEGFFSNEDLQTGFAWREIGLFVEDSNGNEILYSYANAGDTYDYIPATADERYSKYIRIATAIGNATNISIVESEGILYVDTVTFNNAIENLQTDIDQLWASKKIADSVISVHDSADLPFVGMNIFGKSTQKSITGKNLFEITATTQTTKGVTFTINNDGTVTANGTATSSIYFELGVFSLPNGNYIMSGCEKGSKSTYLMYMQKEDGSGYVDLTDGEKVFTISDSDERKLLLAVYTGTTVSNLTFHPMISVEGGTYEPYTGCVPSPSPEYPQEIVSLGDNGEITIGVHGKNLLNIDEVTVENHQSFTLPVPLPVGKYSFRAHIVSDDTDGELSTVVFMNGNQNVAYIPLKRGDVTYTFNAKIPIEKVDFCAAYNYSQGDGDTATWSNIQLEFGDAVSEYEKSRVVQTIGVSTPNGLLGIPVTSGGNYTDANGQQWVCDEIDLERGVRINRCGVKTLNGSEFWYLYDFNDAQGISYYVGLDGALKGLSISLCDKFRNVVYSWDSRYKGAFGIYSDHPDGKYKYFRAPNDSVTTLDEWKEWLASNPIEVVYALAEPTETALTDTEIATYQALCSYNPNTTILNDAGADMEVEYITKAHEGVLKTVLNKMRSDGYNITIKPSYESSGSASTASNTQMLVNGQTVYDFHEMAMGGFGSVSFTGVKTLQFIVAYPPSSTPVEKDAIRFGSFPDVVNESGVEGHTVTSPVYNITASGTYTLHFYD